MCIFVCHYREERAIDLYKQLKMKCKSEKFIKMFCEMIYVTSKTL